MQPTEKLLYDVLIWFDQAVSWGTVAAKETSIMSALKMYGPLSIAMNIADSFYNYK